MANRTYVAIDLGASSGRVLAAHFDGTRISFDELHRFPNGAVSFAGHLYWDALRLWEEIQHGLRAAHAAHGDQIVSIGIDTWGVDFALLDRNDQMLGNPFHYRDPQTQGIIERACDIVPAAEIFQETGLQFNPLNTLFQLVALREQNSPLLEMANSFLMIPDLFNWLMTGEKRNEFTDASTTQFLNPETRDWSRGLLERFDLPTDMLGTIAEPGTNLGPILRSVQNSTGLGAVPVVLPGTHDTASAVLSVPTTSEPGAQPNWCYISSGTWSLMGAEVSEPVINEACREYNFTNEGGIGGTTRLLKNIAGLWLIQECRRIWAREGQEYSWEELNQMAAEAEPLRSLIRPDDTRFYAPENMPAEIAAACRESGQPEPNSHGATIRCALESLAIRYRTVLGRLEKLTGGTFETIHVVGGGSQNALLNQMTATACGRPVLAGPVEATALGNVLMQAVAMGDIGSVLDGREIVGRSFPLHRFTPGEAAPWDNALMKLKEN